MTDPIKNKGVRPTATPEAQPTAASPPGESGVNKARPTKTGTPATSAAPGGAGVRPPHITLLVSPLRASQPQRLQGSRGQTLVNPHEF
jgi:hypothetical protein